MDLGAARSIVQPLSFYAALCRFVPHSN